VDVGGQSCLSTKADVQTVRWFAHAQVGLEVPRSLAVRSHREIFAEQITALAVAYWPLAARRHQPRTPRGRTVQLMRGRRQRYCGMSLAYPSESCQISQPYVHPPALQKLWSLGHRQ
jgi:hypothetical protein